MQAKRPTPELRKLVPAYWPSPLSPLPSPLSPSLSPSRTRRRGISLLEVLAAIGVLSVGLLGLAALLPIGIFTIGEATKANRAGQCGRAALRDIVVRRMLDSSYWSANPGNSLSFIIDPLGLNPLQGRTAVNAKFGNGATVVPRISLLANNANGVPAIPYNNAMAAAVFQATDDLVISMPEDLNLKPPLPVGRPVNIIGGVASPLAPDGAYSWFLTVTPQPNNPTRFTVSVVVCCNRTFTPTGERAVAVASFFDQTAIPGSPTPVALGGGSILLSARTINDTAADVTANSVANIAIKENEWVALCSQAGLCRWYRVAQVGDPDPQLPNQQYLTLIGPDWTPAQGDQLVAVGQSVLGVYTTTIDLDTDPTWKN